MGKSSAVDFLFGLNRLPMTKILLCLTIFSCLYYILSSFGSFYISRVNLSSFVGIVGFFCLGLAETKSREISS